MPTAISIVAKIDGKMFAAFIDVGHLEWRGVDVGSLADDNALPQEVYEIIFATEKGAFRQVFPTKVIDSSCWGKIKRWWKDRRYGREWDYD